MIAETRPGHRSEPEIDFSTFPSSDGKPMADTERNQREMINVMFALRQPLEPRGHHLGGDLLIYYNPANGLDPGTLWVSPDVFVALDRDTELRKSRKTWVEGKFPKVVVEIASPTTEQGQHHAELAQRQAEARALDEEIARRHADPYAREQMGARREADRARREAVGIASGMVLKILTR